ncbi:MAG: PEP-CTERM sorting domain-containing protein [Verrucomicrobia bacterium]|nr:PEP-CTERM sorting domain-containing protein [Verrucomicrobiota bacterium]
MNHGSKIFSGLLLVLSTALAGATSSSSFQIFENFNDYTPLQFLTEHPSWTTTDGWENNGVVSPDGYPDQGNAGYIGQGAPGPTPTLPVNLNRSISYDQSQNLVSLRWVQTLANPNPDDGIRDTFGWAVKDTLGRTLASIKFANGEFPNSDETAAYNTKVEVYRGDWSGQNLTGSNPQQAIGLFDRGGPTVFEIAINTTGHYFSLGYAATGGNYDTTGSFNFINLVDNAPVNYSGDFQVGSLTALWGLEHPLPLSNEDAAGDPYMVGDNNVYLHTGAGGNLMMFDNLAISATTATAIPEPSSLALLGIGSLMLLGFRKSRKA